MTHGSTPSDHSSLTLTRWADLGNAFSVKKLIQGILEFRRTTQTSYRLNFGKLAAGQSPDALFVACSDSRVVPNTFASTNPGDLFVLRNVGNLIPPCGHEGFSESDESEVAAIEYAILTLNVSDIIICGHSECGAMRALTEDRSQLPAAHLRSWLRHGDQALAHLKAGKVLDPALSLHNQLSQLNVLQQMEHIRSYPVVRQRIEEGKLGIHGWWFELSHAEVHAYHPETGKFSLIDEQTYSESAYKKEDPRG